MRVKETLPKNGPQDKPQGTGLRTTGKHVNSGPSLRETVETKEKKRKEACRAPSLLLSNSSPIGGLPPNVKLLALDQPKQSFSVLS